MFKNVGYQSFSPVELRNRLRRDDFRTYGIKKENLQSLIEGTASTAARSDYKISTLSATKTKKGKTEGRDTLVFSTPELGDCLLIRQANKILRTFTGRPSFDRDEEVRLLSSLVSTELDAHVLRTDIKNFFDSIRFKDAIECLIELGFDNLSTLKILTSISRICESYGFDGLPRGLAISSTLADIYMLDFDKRVHDMTLFYSRYVDDLIMILERARSPKQVMKDIRAALPGCLTTNNGKTQYWDISQKPEKGVDYLGYHLALRNVASNKRRVQPILTITITSRKIKKTKTRLCQSIAAFNKSSNQVNADVQKEMQLLLQRLQFLTCNTRMKMANRERKVHVGFRYSYRLCGECDEVLKQMVELDQFFHGVINSRTYRPAIRMRTMLTKDVLRNINNLSFVHGYKKRISFSLSRQRIAILKRPWRQP